MIDSSQFERKHALIAFQAILVLVALVAGYGVAQILETNSTPTIQDPTTPTNDAVTFNDSELLTSHRHSLDTERPYQIELHASQVDNNTSSTVYRQQSIVMDSATYTYERDTLNRTTAKWHTNNTTYLYQFSNNTTRTINDSNIQTQQTQYLFIQQVLNAGSFEYTNISVVGETEFRLTSVNDTSSLLYAYPGMSGNSNGTVTNVTINGTVENGIITQLEGSFDYQPPVENTSIRHYAFNMTVQEGVTISEPTWVQEYSESEERTANNSSTTESIVPSDEI